MKTKYKWIKLTTALFLITMFILFFIRQWTNFPSYKIIYISSEQDQLNTSKGLADYLGAFSSFAFFTTLSNVIAISLISIEWISLGKFKLPEKVKLYGLLYMIVTGIVFWTSIAPFMPWGFDRFFDYENTHEHFVVLVITILFAIESRTKVKARKKDYLYMMLFPIIYLIFATLINIFTPEHIAIYAFLDYYNFFGAGLPLAASVVVTILFIILLLFVFLWGYWLLLKLFNKTIIDTGGKMNKVTIKKIPFKLNGTLGIKGTLNFKAIDKNEQVKDMSSYKGMKVISAFPDINTRICDLQTIAISKYADKHKNINFISITNDKVEVIKQWCAVNGIDNIDILSDEKLKEFQNKTNTLIVRANKLARGFIILDENNNVLDYSFKKEIAEEPDYLLLEKYVK